MPTIKPYRQYSEHEVINLFKFSGTLPANKGTFVKIQSGFKCDVIPVDMIGGIGASYNNTVSQRWGVPQTVIPAVSGDLNVLGMTLYDVKEVDENNEVLIYHPQKADELQCVLSGQAVPILTRGIVTYSGILGSPADGAAVYIAAGGVPSATGLAAEKIGKVLGQKDHAGWAVLKIEL